MDDKELIERLRAALSWEMAPSTHNPAYQAFIEIKRDIDPTFINPLGISEKYKELFD